MSESRWFRAGKQLLIYLACIAITKYLIGFSAMAVSRYTNGLLRLLGYGSVSDVFSFYAGNWLVFNAAVGLLAGFLLYAKCNSVAILFTWVPFGAILTWNILNYHASILVPDAMAGFHHFLSLGCKEASYDQVYISARCADQFRYSLPFYAAAGLSIGALLRRLMGQRIAAGLTVY